MSIATEKTTITCSGCSAQRETKRTAKNLARVPGGWKRHPDNVRVYCATCWGDRYLLRAIEIPVAGPVGREWSELREAIKGQWSAFTAASNWMLSELYVRDIKREATMEKCPPMPRVYLYPEARQRFPSLPSQAVASLEQAVQRKYRANRFKIVWTCQQSLANYRYPAPAICPAQGWTAKLGDDNEPLLSVRLGNERWLLRLRGGAEFSRQKKAFEQIVSEEAVPGELAILRRRAHSNDNRNGVTERENGNKQQYRVTVKMVAWLPRGPVAAKQGTLKARLDSEAFLIALNFKDEKVWAMHAAHLKQWEAEHRKNLNYFADDQKSEQRPVPTFAAKRSAMVAKYRQRMNTFCHTAAAQLAGYAARRKFAAVHLDDTYRLYVPRFPWYKFLDLLREKLGKENIALTLASGEVSAKSPGPLAEE